MKGFEDEQLIAKAREVFRASPGYELGVERDSQVDLMRRLADNLEDAHAVIEKARATLFGELGHWTLADVRAILGAVTAPRPDLADHDRRIKAEAAATALEEAAKAADSKGHHWSGPTAPAMFNLADELRARAAEIRKATPDDY